MLSMNNPWWFIVLLAVVQAAKYWVLKPPVSYEYVRGHRFECDYFGHMYSFEYIYSNVLLETPYLLADSIEEADFIVLHQCITFVYHNFRYSLGFETVELSWEAMRISQTEYLLPMIQWAKAQPAYKKSNGTNFVIVFALDKGRADWPYVDHEIKHWHAITTVGNSSYLHDRPGIWSRGEATGAPICLGEAANAIRPLVVYPQDVVVPVVTAFSWNERSGNTKERTILVYFSGSPNSCLRRYVLVAYNNFTERDVVVRRVIPRNQFQEYLYRSKFCLVPDGFSFISARHYEVIMHGCVPVILTDGFHPPYELSFPYHWKEFAVFVRRADAKDIPNILRRISHEQYLKMHKILQFAATVFDSTTTAFWNFLDKDLVAHHKLPATLFSGSNNIRTPRKQEIIHSGNVSTHNRTRPRNIWTQDPNILTPPIQAIT